MGEPLDDKEARRLSILQDTHAYEHEQCPRLQFGKLTIHRHTYMHAGASKNAFVSDSNETF